MAGYKYFVILTDIGKQKLAQAIATESPLDFTEMAVGDSNGTSYNPTPDMTALKHETYRATISNVSIDEVDRNIMIFQLVVPSSSGGYYIREAGLFSSDGSLIAIARTAEQYKPQLSEGAGASIDINMRIAISSEAQIYINVPESDSYATQNYVQEEFKKHKEEEAPHSIYTEAIENLKNNKADKTHKHELSSLNGVLPVNKGGTGANNIVDARKALKTFRQNQLVSGADLNDISYYEREMTIKHFNVGLKNRPTQAAESGDYITSVQTEQNRGWQIFREIGRSKRGSFGTYGRLYNNGVWDDWFILRNSDGTIPFEMGGTPLTYTNSYGTWTETTLSNGKILLEGIGNRVLEANQTYKVEIPKKLTANNAVIVSGATHTNVVSTITVSNGLKQATISNNGVRQEVNFIIKGIVA